MFKRFMRWLGSILCALGGHNWEYRGAWVKGRVIILGFQTARTEYAKMPTRRECRRCGRVEYPEYYGSLLDSYRWVTTKASFPPGVSWMGEEES